MGLLVFSGATWDEGSQPYQDLKLLVTLRNAITHMKTDTWSVTVSLKGPDPEREPKQYPKFVLALNQKGLIEVPTSSESWLQAVAKNSVANWSCQTASRITREFHKVVPNGYFKDQLADQVFDFTE